MTVLQPLYHVGRNCHLHDLGAHAYRRSRRRTDTAPARHPDDQGHFAVGHYTHGFIEAQTGDPKTAIGSADRSCHLSPFDPLLFGMLGSRALALFRMGAFDEAADWALRASARPNAHVHIHAIAAHCLAAADRRAEARRIVASIQAQAPGYRVDDFPAAFRFPASTQTQFRKIAARIGTA